MFTNLRRIRSLEALLLTLVLIGAFLAPTAGRCDPEDSDIYRGPYIQNLSSTSARIVWYNRRGGYALLRLNPPIKQEMFAAKFEPGRAEVRLEHLAPGQRYVYEIVSRGGELSAQGSFKTAPNPHETEPIRFAVFGDSGSGYNAQLEVAEQIERWNPSFLLHTGDIVYPDGSDREYDRKFFIPYRSLLPKFPFFPSIGNHDAITIADYQKIYSLPSAPGAHERYYSFNYGYLHIVSLDTNLPLGPGEPQHEWLLSDLNQASLTKNRAWTVVFFHHPPFSAGTHEDSPEVASHLVPIFERFRVDLVLSGHDHAYERSGLTAIGGDPKAKVLYVVTGGGGKEVYEQAVFDHPHIERYESIHHFVGITATPQVMRFNVLSSNGAPLDSFELSKGSPNQLKVLQGKNL